MFYLLIIGNFILVLAVSLLVMKVFSKSVDRILQRIIKDDISLEWSKYIKFSALVVGISSGMPTYSLSQYLPNENVEKFKPLVLTSERMVLEIYQTVIETLQGMAYAYCLFFVIALLAYVVIKRGEYKNQKEIENG